jgi:hypothetical protein
VTFHGAKGDNAVLATFPIEVVAMPFNSSYRDFDRQRYIDSRDYFIGLAKLVVREPLSTHIVKTTTPSGKISYLVVDRSITPDEGGQRPNRKHLSEKWGSMEHGGGTVLPSI